MHAGAFPSVLLRGIAYSVVSGFHFIEGSAPEEKKMESNIDIKELWNRQTVPAADQSEILNKISHFRKNALKKGIFLDVILVLPILFMIFICIYFKPQFLSTKIGIFV